MCIVQHTPEWKMSPASACSAAATLMLCWLCPPWLPSVCSSIPSCWLGPSSAPPQLALALVGTAHQPDPWCAARSLSAAASSPIIPRRPASSAAAAAHSGSACSAASCRHATRVCAHSFWIPCGESNPTSLLLHAVQAAHCMLVAYSRTYHRITYLRLHKRKKALRQHHTQPCTQ